MQYKLKLLQFIPNASSKFLWSISDAYSQMINYFESILFKGLIKPVGKPVTRFVNQFERFVQFPAARADGSHSDNIKSQELDLQSIESKSAKACLLELYEDIFHRFRKHSITEHDIYDISLYLMYKVHVQQCIIYTLNKLSQSMK